jgi:hypothetical protein
MVTFGVAGLMLIISCVFYFFGTLFQKICNDLAPPDYILLAHTVDNRTLWGGVTLVTVALRNRLNSSQDWSITHILKYAATCLLVL